MSTSHPSRFYREVAAGRLTAAELATIHRNEEQRLEAFQGYTDLTTSTRRANRSIFDDFQIWYQNVYQAPDGADLSSASPFDGIDCNVAGVDTLFSRISGFLSCLLDFSYLRNDNVHVTATTFAGWGHRLASIAIETLTRNEQQRTGHLASQWTTVGKDQLTHKLDLWMKSTAVKENLSQQGRERHAYGKPEAALCINSILEDCNSPMLVASAIQKVALIQWSINRGERPGDVLKGDDNEQGYLRTSDVTIRRMIPGQDAPNESQWRWTVSIKMTDWKGARNPLLPKDVQQAICSPTSSPSNLQFELATTLVPLLIWRKLLVSVDAHGQEESIPSVQAFLSCEQTLFKGIGDDPLFVAMKGGWGSENGGLLLDQPLTTQSFFVLLGKIYAKVGLGDRGAYPFRFEKGDKMRILFGSEAQAATLHHDLGQVGYRHYSSGMQNIPVSRAMIDETPEEVAMLEAAGYYSRALSSHAMTAVLRSRASIEGDASSHEAIPRFDIPIVNRAALTRQIQDDEEIQRLDSSIEEKGLQIRQGEDPRTRITQQQLQQYKKELEELTEQRSRRRTNIYKSMSQRLFWEHRDRIKSMTAGGTVDDVIAAKEYLDGLDARDFMTASHDWISRTIASLWRPNEGEQAETEVSRAAFMLFYEGLLNSHLRVTVVHDVWATTGTCPYCDLSVARTRNVGTFVGSPLYNNPSQQDERQRKEAMKKVRKHLAHSHPAIWSSICAGCPLPQMTHEFDDSFDLPSPPSSDGEEIDFLDDELPEFISQILDEAAQELE